MSGDSVAAAICFRELVSGVQSIPLGCRKVSTISPILQGASFFIHWTGNPHERAGHPKHLHSAGKSPIDSGYMYHEGDHRRDAEAGSVRTYVSKDLPTSFREWQSLQLQRHQARVFVSAVSILSHFRTCYHMVVE